MKSTIWSALMVVAVCLTELAHGQAGETPDILHAGSGQITWTNINPALYYTVEWRHSLTTGEWSSVYSWFRDIQSQDGVISREIPAFFQIRAHDTPGYLHYLTATSSVVQAGYYAATNLTLVEPNLTAANIRGGATIFGIQGVVLPSTGDATPTHVLDGRTFSNTEASGATGTMPDRGAQNVTPGTTAQTILLGYHDGTGEVAGDADLAAANIKTGVNIFGVDGAVVESTGDAGVGQVLAGATFSKAGEAGLTGTMPDQADRGFMPGAADVTIPAGYYSGAGVVTGDAALVTGNIRAGVTIFGVEGSFSGSTPWLNGMILIPGGVNSGTNPLGAGEEYSVSYPSNYYLAVDSFYMAQSLVSSSLWVQVQSWGVTNGYTDLAVQPAKAPRYPANRIAWHDAVKWCNALSEMNGISPAYYTNDTRDVAHIYRTGNIDLESEWVDWNSGYRLPTSDEWEYAARGGLTSQRFPWGNRISHEHANYRANGGEDYCDSSPAGFHPEFHVGEWFTDGYSNFSWAFPANNYGLYDMAGNMLEWCFDWHPDHLGDRRIVRGGAYSDSAMFGRSGFKDAVRVGGAMGAPLGFRFAHPVIPASNP